MAYTLKSSQSNIYDIHLFAIYIVLHVKIQIFHFLWLNDELDAWENVRAKNKYESKVYFFFISVEYKFTVCAIIVDGKASRYIMN